MEIIELPMDNISLVAEVERTNWPNFKNNLNRAVNYRERLSGAVSNSPCGALLNDLVLSEKVEASS